MPSSLFFFFFFFLITGLFEEIFSNHNSFNSSVLVTHGNPGHEWGLCTHYELAAVTLREERGVTDALILQVLWQRERKKRYFAKTISILLDTLS